MLRRKQHVADRLRIEISSRSVRSSKRSSIESLSRDRTVDGDLAMNDVNCGVLSIIGGFGQLNCI